MSVFVVKILGSELVDQDGTVEFVTDWQEVEQTYDKGKVMSLSAEFPNTLSSQKTMTLQVCNDDDNNPLITDGYDLVSSDTDDSLVAVIQYKYVRFKYTIQGGAPTGVISSIKAELI